jgi:hypothetical protein
MAFRLATTAARAPDVRDASAARAPNPSAGSMEHLILAALEARSGGDLVYRRNHKSGKLFCLALGIHDMRTVARELAERSSHINARWMRRFYRAWRALCDSGAHLGDGAYIDGGRNRFYVRLTGRPASPPPPAAVCRECGVDLMTTHGLAKWCATCKAKMFKHRNVQARAERSKRLRIQLAAANASAAARILPQ